MESTAVRREAPCESESSDSRHDRHHRLRRQSLAKKRKSGDGVVGQSPAKKRKSGDGVVAAPMEIADQSHSEIESDSRAGSRAGRPLRLIPARGADCESEREHRKGPGGFGSTDALSPAVGGVVESTPAVGRESDSSLGRRIRQQPLAWTHVYQSLPDDLIQLLADSLPVADMQRPEGQGCVGRIGCRRLRGRQRATATVGRALPGESLAALRG